SDTFAVNLVKHPNYNKKLVDMVRPAYATLLREINSVRGKTLDRRTIQSLIEKALATDEGVSEPAGNLFIHNWSVEKFDIEPEFVLDWSSSFQRETRAVPTEKVWNEQLLPQLYNTRKEIAGRTAVRLIRLRGKCALSTGIALGAAFPQIGGWVFEIP